MASSDDFKKQLKAGKIADALAIALSQALELEITTWVASSSESDVEASSSAANLSKPGDRLRTRISLIEGKIENEIGNQFIGSGPYRDLRQFHQQQVTDSNKTIENNLNSLQKLFGILVRMRQPSADAPATPNESPEDIGEILPPADKVAESTLGLPSAVEGSVPSPGGLAAIELAQTQPLPAAPATSLESSSPGMKEQWEDLVLDEPSPATAATNREAASVGIEENWQELVVEELFQGAPAPSQPYLDVGTNEDWGDMVAAEPSPVTPATSLQASSPGVNEDWGDMVEEQPTPASPSREVSSLETDEGWEDFVEEQPSPASRAPASLETDEGWEDLEEEQPSPAYAAPSSLETDEDWGDLLEEEQPSPASRAPASLETDEDWGDLLEEQPSPASRAPSNSASKLVTDEEWGELPGEHPQSFAAVPAGDGYSLDMGIEEHWEKFEVAEMEPHGATSEAVSFQPTPPANAVEELDDLADLISLESELNQSSDYDLLVEDFEEDSFARTMPRREGVDSAASADSLADLFGESSPPAQTFDESVQSSPARADMTPGTHTSAPDPYSIEDALFLEVEESPLTRSLSDDTISSLDDADLLAAFDEDDRTTHLRPANESSVLITPPPPPPQNQPKNQSNEKQGG